MDTQEQILIKDLRETDIFAGLSNNALEQIAGICELLTYQAGERPLKSRENLGHQGSRRISPCL